MSGQAAIADESRFEPAPSVVSRVVGSDLVLVDLDAEQFHSLNPVGALIWGGLSDGGSVRSVLSSVTSEFEIDEVTARADLVELVESLLALGLLVPAERSGPA